MATNIYIRMLLCERVKLEPSFLHRQYRDEVVRRLKLKVEGLCSRHGFIRPDSIEIHKICTGKVELVGLNGNTEFDVVFYADVCNPMLGSVIKCRVSNINKFGILAEAENVIEAIIAKNSVNIQSDVDLDKVRIGDDIFIEVVGKKYELNERKISLIGRVVRDTTSRKSLSSSFEDNKSKKTLLDGGADAEDVDADDVDADDVDADVRSLVDGAKSDEDSDGDGDSDGDSDSGGDSEDAEDAEDADDAESGIFSDDEGVEDSVDDDEAKHNGNFFSDDEEPEFGVSDNEGSFQDDEEDTTLSDDE
jgi:DNA-directed RNA polymerase subunit E'/Rpb7